MAQPNESWDVWLLGTGVYILRFLRWHAIVVGVFRMVGMRVAT